ncbi:MAG: hypothetical protein NUW22_05030 [Acidobacteria bacterium]|nr:hypothetical protein [Acidobacteriota bacterium]
MAMQVTSVLVIPTNDTFSLGCATFGASRRADGQFRTLVNRIERVSKNGEMAPIPWLTIHISEGLTVEAREADCIIVTEAVRL